MGAPEIQRRLAAILAADVAGYTRLMEADEDATVAAWKSVRSEVIDPKITEYGGRIVKHTGDGFLAEFGTIADTVRCAVSMQQEIGNRNADVDPDRRMDFRMGINMGDIVVDDEDIHGDGVNIAARLESLAETGGICVSGAVHNQVNKRLDFEFEALGDQQVKNLSTPIRAFRIRLDRPIASRSKDTTRPVEEDKPSIAVLPFNNMSGDPEQEYFSDGITEDLITDLSKISGLFVIARNSSFMYKGRAVDIKQVGRELGVRFVLEGSVRKAGNRVRINAQLLDSATGGHLWAERYDGEMNDIFDLQDEISAQIVSALEVSLSSAEKAGVEKKLTNSVEAYDLYLRGRTKYLDFTPAAFAEGIRLLEAAIDIDLNFAAAYAYLSIPYQCTHTFVWPGHETALQKGLAAAQKAVAIDNELGLAHMSLGWIQNFLGDNDAAVTSMERALELNPHSAEPLAYFGEVLNFAGDPERAIEMTKLALKYDPTLPPNCAFHLGHSYYLLERYDEAIENVTASLLRAPGFPFAHIILAAIYGELGRDEEAESEIKTVIELSPQFGLNNLRKLYTYSSEDVCERLLSSLKKAGLPD